MHWVKRILFKWLNGEYVIVGGVDQVNVIQKGTISCYEEVKFYTFVAGCLYYWFSFNNYKPLFLGENCGNRWQITHIIAWPSQYAEKMINFAENVISLKSQKCYIVKDLEMLRF